MAVVTRKLLIMYLFMSVSIILSSSDFLFDIKLLDQTEPSEIRTNLLSPNSSPIDHAFDSNNETIFHSNYLSNSGDIYLSYNNKKIMNVVGFSPQLFYTNRLPERIIIYGMNENKMIKILERELEYHDIKQGDIQYFTFSNDDFYGNYIISINNNDPYLCFSEIILANGKISYGLRDGLIFLIIIISVSLSGIFYYERAK